MLDQKHDFIPNSESQVIKDSVRKDISYGNVCKRIFRRLRILRVERTV